MTAQIDMSSLGKLIQYLPMLTDYDRGRLIGIGEGAAMVMKTKRPDEASEEKEAK